MRQSPRPATQPTQPSRARRVALLLSTGAMLGTTALVAALEPKLPPFRGD